MSNSEYFYGTEAEQFSFFRIPRALMKDPRFRSLSTDAKLLYGLMLDRMSLPQRSGWLDEQNRVFIYFTLEEIQEVLVCGHNKATCLLVELEQYALIERVRQGQGKPTKLYVKRFTTRTMPSKPAPPKPDPIMPFSEVEKIDPNYIKSNDPDLSEPDPSIYPPSPQAAARLEMDRYEKRDDEIAGRRPSDRST